MSVEIRVSGPMFNGIALAGMRRFLHEAVASVGQQAYSNVMANLNASIVNPTPYYETQIVVHEVGLTSLISDRGIIYGPWLEGTGSRNRTTRFKGYHSFRRAKIETQAQVPMVVRGARNRFIRVANG